MIAPRSSSRFVPLHNAQPQRGEQATDEIIAAQLCGSGIIMDEPSRGRSAGRTSGSGWTSGSENSVGCEDNRR